MALLSPIADGLVDTSVEASILGTIGMGLGRSQIPTSGIAGDARTKLNVIAASKGLPQIPILDSGLNALNKINAIMSSVGANQDLDFLYDSSKDLVINDGPFAPADIFTDTHGDGNAMVQNAAGVWSSVSANALSVSDLGIWVYPSRTNSIRNSSMVGAVVAGTGPNLWNSSTGTELGITKAIAGVGTEGGLPYIDISYDGVASSSGQIQTAFESSTLVVAVKHEIWTASYFVKLISGTPSTGVRVVINENTSTGVYINEGASANFTPDSTRQRKSVTRTIIGDNTARITPYIKISVSGGVEYHFVLRIYAPQLEAGPYPSPPILTTNASKTRIGNVITMDLPSGASAGIGMYVKQDILGMTTNNQPNFFSVISPVKLTKSLHDTAVNLGTTATGPKTIVAANSPGYMKVREYGGTDFASVAADYDNDVAKLALGGNGFDTSDNLYSIFQKIGIKTGIMNDTIFNEIYEKAA